MLIVASTRGADVCLTDTTGTCRLFGCRSSRGPTNCDSGKCVCKPGYCAYAGKCQKPTSCDTSTPGTCNLLPCKSKRGATQCIDGHCVCEPGACATDGVCYKGCPKDTGGNCKLFDCAASRGATCNWPSCECEEGKCALEGKCVTGAVYAAALAAAGNRTASLTAYAPAVSFSDHVNNAADALEEPLALGGAVALASTLFIGLSVLRRRVVGAAIGEPLLDSTEAGKQTVA